MMTRFPCRCRTLSTSNKRTKVSSHAPLIVSLGLDGDSGPHAGASVKCSVEKVLQFHICLPLHPRSVSALADATRITETTHMPLVVSLGLDGDPGPHAGALHAVHLQHCPHHLSSRLLARWPLADGPALEQVDQVIGPRLPTSKRRRSRTRHKFKVLKILNWPASPLPRPAHTVGQGIML